MSNKKQMRLAGFHEAGHCIAGWIRGQRLSFVEIDNYGHGQIVGNEPILKDLGGISYQSETTRACVRALMAGPCSQLYEDNKLFAGLYQKDFKDDVDQAMKFMVCQGWESEGYTREKFFLEFSRSAKFFVISYFREIRKLAQELIQKKYLTGQEAVKLIQDVWTDNLPPLALPLAAHKRL
jgi:hypothetical protein